MFEPVSWCWRCPPWSCPAVQPGQAGAGNRIPLADVARANCPQGLERHVPGEYYCCVGVRDPAAGKFARAGEMLDEAARWDNKRAQFLLGVGYFEGDAGQLNRPLGLAYLQLSSERDTPFYLAVYRSAAKRHRCRSRGRPGIFCRR
ncbi:hypothetical protein [Dyella lutea]|uniref:Sel1 repeat-containing protein n=1 Tax=Dyella lutea TaxID=2950441 RepID=A0ABT1FFN8_9GAMM|nr:hypothetical protein [Dyella lutea]MCP1376201.1 hypothetical protein [Dyella lutea]